MSNPTEIEQSDDGPVEASLLEGCTTSLPLDRFPTQLRFVEITTLAGRVKIGAPAQYLMLRPEAARVEGVDRKELVDQVRGELRAILGKREGQRALPDPDAPIEEIRAAMLGHRSVTSDIREVFWAQGVEVAVQRSAYKDWYGTQIVEAAQQRLGLLDELRIFKSRQWESEEALVSDATNWVLTDEYQPLPALDPQIAVVTTYTQSWEVLGYTRGELLSTLTLAPGEQLDVEVHSWDKSTVKTEEELLTESELRVTSTQTNRDALTVVTDYAKETNTSIDARGSVPIPKMPIEVSASIDTIVSNSTSETEETLSEGTVETASVLKSARKSRVEVARDFGSERRQTRSIVNPNTCHTLNVQYFEVMSNYRVRTALTEVAVCLLVDDVKPNFDLDYVLCHEATLTASLRDSLYLAGFGAAKYLKAAQTLQRLKIERAEHLLTDLSSDAKPYLTELRTTMGRLADATSAFKQDINDCSNKGSILGLLCQLQIDPTTLHRASFWLAAVPYAVKSTARSLYPPLFTAEQNAAAVLHRFVGVAISFLGTEGPIEPQPSAVRGQLIAAGLRSDLAEGFTKPDQYVLDDAGFATALRAAQGFLLSATTAAADLDEPAIDAERAVHQVEWERLRCHLEDNWCHYAEAVWRRRSPTSQLQFLDQAGVAPLVDRELLGFHDGRAAFRVRAPDALGTSVDLNSILTTVREAAAKRGGSERTISLPANGTYMEAVLGQCNACEENVVRSQELELRSRTAAAELAELENQRRAALMELSDLRDPAPPPAVIPVSVQIDSDDDQ